MASKAAPPKKKRKLAINQQFENIAAQPSLELLPDNIILTIMSLVDITSLIRLSRVCRRFHHLYTDVSVWTDIDLTTIKLDIRKLKKVIHERLPTSLRSIRLASTRKKQIVTASVLDELFSRCPNIEAISLEHCDLTQFPPNCKLFHSSTLERVAIVTSATAFKWMEAIKPSWPKLTHLSLNQSVKTSDGDLKFLCSSPTIAQSLKSLSIVGCYRVSAAGIKEVCESLVNLKSLNLSSCVGVNIDECIEYIAKLPQLKHLSMDGIDFSQNTSDRLPKLFPNLSSLTTSIRDES